MVRILRVSIVVLIVAGSMVIGVSWGQNRPAVNDFADKVVTVYVTEGQDVPGVVLESVEIRDVGGRNFLVGVGADTGQADNPAKGVEVGVAWDSVAVYLAMTREQFSAKLKEER